MSDLPRQAINTRLETMTWENQSLKYFLIAFGTIAEILFFKV